MPGEAKVLAGQAEWRQKSRYWLQSRLLNVQPIVEPLGGGAKI